MSKRKLYTVALTDEEIREISGRAERSLRHWQGEVPEERYTVAPTAREKRETDDIIKRKTLDVPPGVCSTCRGNGVRPGSGDCCSECNGSGSFGDPWAGI